MSSPELRICQSKQILEIISKKPISKKSDYKLYDSCVAPSSSLEYHQSLTDYPACSFHGFAAARANLNDADNKKQYVRPSASCAGALLTSPRSCEATRTCTAASSGSSATRVAPPWREWCRRAEWMKIIRYCCTRERREYTVVHLSFSLSGSGGSCKISGTK